jgi:hypothetical protein
MTWFPLAPCFGKIRINGNTQQRRVMRSPWLLQTTIVNGLRFA